MAIHSEDMDWSGAQWIGAATSSLTTDGFVVVEKADADNYQSMRLRREFEVKPQLHRATISVCGLGQYELTIDGTKVGDYLFTPGWTNYKKTCLYDTYDVTHSLQSSGLHTLGLLLGNGMYHVESTSRYNKFVGSFGPLKAILRLNLEYTIGPSEVVATDKSWRINPGPITYSHMFGGEDYDGRLEAPGWDSPGYDDANWHVAAALEGPGGKLRGDSAAAPPIRAIQTLEVATVKKLRENIFVYDLGQNAAVMPRITVRGASGAIVRIIPGELLHAEGTVDRFSCGGGMAYWQYTLAGNSKLESYFPKFWSHGCRYLQVECAGEIKVESLEGVVVHSSCEPIGNFACSNELFNRIYTLVKWAQRSNMVSLMTDCPHRERLGWLEQTHLNGPALRYNFRLEKLCAKTMNDMAETQLPDGMVTTTAPEFTIFPGAFRNSPEWSSAFVQIGWQQYEFCGDLELLKTYYEELVRYLEFLDRSAQGNIVSFGLSDWYDIGPGEPGPSKLTPLGVTGTAFFYDNTIKLAKVAKLLGREEDVTKFGKQAERIRDSFNETFFHADTNQYASGSQCANAMALVMGLADPSHRAAILENIITDIESKGLTAGDVGFRYLLRALADGNRSDVIFQMNNQSTTPGYGLMLANGATSLTEAWDANPISSQNHFMLGQINEWFFHDLAGIQSDPDGPGFRKIVLKPTVVGDLTWVKASYVSVQGEIVSEWKQEDQHVTVFIVTVPARTSATVVLPTGARPSVVHSGVKFVKVEDGCTFFEISDAGTYRFSTAP